VEIRDTLTLDKHSTLQPTKTVPKDLKPIGHSPSALAYSPDGHSLGGCFGSAATIWDIQTGGVIKEIECGVVDASPKSLVWSLDGTTIGAIFSAGVGNWIVFTCDIASVKVSTPTIQSPYEPYLWPDGSSIWVMATSEDKATIDTFEVWPTATVYPVKSYSVTRRISCNPPPVMHQDGFLSGNFNKGELHIYNMHNWECVLYHCGFFTANCFSPNGGLFAASGKNEVCIWKLGGSKGYFLWKRFPLWEALGDTPRSYKFSPTSSSLLISREGYLEVQSLEGSITHTPEKTTLIEISTNGTYLVTAFKSDMTVTIINLYNSHSQCIVTNLVIYQLSLIGNILIVRGPSGYSAAWRLTAEGIVDGASDIRKACHSSSLWIKQLRGHVRFWANSQVSIIEDSWENTDYYDMETGEVFNSAVLSIPSLSSPSWKDLYHDSDGIDFSTWPPFSYYDLVEYNGHPSKDNLPASTPWCQEGWLMYPEGEYQHQLWLPTHWRTKWEEAHWLNEIKMLRFSTASGKVIIKL